MLFGVLFCCWDLFTLLGTITYSLPFGIFESMTFLFSRWDMLVPWRVVSRFDSGLKMMSDVDVSQLLM